MRTFKVCLATLLVGAAAAIARPASEQTIIGGDDWVLFADESGQRIIATPDLGITDPVEKDLISGDLDIIVARKVRFSTPGGEPNVLFMNEDGAMVDRTATLAPDFLDATDDRDVVMVDVDGDGWLDVVTVTTFSEQPRILMNLGETAGTWNGLDYDPADNRLPIFSPAPKFCAVGFGDVTGDDKPDLYFVDYSNSLEDRLLINDGDGFFTDETTTRMTAEMVSSEFGTDGHIVDMNGDGWNDIVKCNTLGGPGIEIIYNDGSGGFDFMHTVNSDAPYMVEPADFTGDGQIDLYVVGDGQDRYLRHTGNDGSEHATFNTQTVANSPNTSSLGGNVKFADLDRDGILDVLVADVDTDIPGCDRQLVVLRGIGPQPSVTYEDPFNGASRNFTIDGVFDVEAVDIDGDGWLDLWVGACDGNRIFMNRTAGDPIFDNDFETGDTSGWNDVVLGCLPDGGKQPLVNAGAVRFGRAGVEVVGEHEGVGGEAIGLGLADRLEKVLARALLA